MQKINKNVIVCIVAQIKYKKNKLTLYSTLSVRRNLLQFFSKSKEWVTSHSIGGKHKLVNRTAFLRFTQFITFRTIGIFLRIDILFIKLNANFPSKA